MVYTTPVLGHGLRGPIFSAEIEKLRTEGIDKLDFVTVHDSLPVTTCYLTKYHQDLSGKSITCKIAPCILPVFTGSPDLLRISIGCGCLRVLRNSSPRYAPATIGIVRKPTTVRLQWLYYSSCSSW